MVLASAADGKVEQAEVDAMLENLSGHPVFRETSADLARGYIREALENLKTWGLPARLVTLAQHLTTSARRRAAYQLASRVVHAKPTPAPQELQVLELLAAAFGLPDDEVARLTMES